MKTTIVSNQSVIDVSIQEYGDVRSIPGFLSTNKLGITETIVSGSKVLIENNPWKRKDIVQYFSGKRQKVTTALVSTPVLNTGTVNIVPDVGYGFRENIETVIVSNQSVIDVVIQEYGDVQALVDLLLNNNISITSSLIPGAKIFKSDSSYKNETVRNYYIANRQKIATNKVVFTQHLFETGLFEFGLFE